MTDDPRDVAAQLYRALEDDDTPAVLELCAEDVTIEYPAAGRLAYGGRWTGRDGVARFMEAHDESEEIVEFKIRRLIGDGDAVMALGTFRGRARPDGGEWATSFVHHLTVEAGLIRRWEAFFDTAAALEARS